MNDGNRFRFRRRGRCTPPLGHLVLAAALVVGAGCDSGPPEACVVAAQHLAPAAVHLVDELPAGLAAVDPAELRAEIDDRSGRTLDQIFGELNRIGLGGGIQPAPGQDPEQLRSALDLARDEGCEVADLRPTLADAFAQAARGAQGEQARRYGVVAEALRTG